VCIFNVHTRTNCCFSYCRIFDKDQNGTLDKEELKVCLKSLGEQLSDEEIDELFRALDTDRNGRLSVMGKEETYLSEIIKGIL